MKVLLKSLEELKEEFTTIVEDDDYLIIDDCLVFSEMIDLLNKKHDAEYEEITDSYIIDGWHFNSNFVKKIITNVYSIDEYRKKSSSL
jgi:hypothetical protein